MQHLYNCIKKHTHIIIQSLIRRSMSFHFEILKNIIIFKHFIFYAQMKQGSQKKIIFHINIFKSLLQIYVNWNPIWRPRNVIIWYKYYIWFMWVHKLSLDQKLQLQILTPNNHHAIHIIVVCKPPHLYFLTTFLFTLQKRSNFLTISPTIILNYLNVDFHKNN